MVGVRRSQGCKQCRKKKKGCDLGRPQCGQCTKVGIDCEYSQRQWTFIPQDAGVSTHWNGNIVLDQSLTCTALENQVLDDFWARYLPQPSQDTAGLDVKVATWCRPVQDFSTREGWVCLALKAVAFMALGRLDDKREYIQHARQLYGRSLRQTNKALQDPALMTSDATLANCKLLGIYEQFRLKEDYSISTQGTDWQRHVEGTCRILQLRGPESVASASGRAFFQDARASAAISALTRRKTPFFTGEGWRNTPSMDHSRPVRDELMDIFVEVPQLLERQDRLDATIAATPHDPRILIDSIALLKACFQLGTRLQTWEQDLLHRATNSTSHANDTNTKPPDTLLEICQSHGYGLFFLATHYWTTALALASSTHLTHHKLARHFSTSKAFLPPVPPYLDPSTFAANIAKTASHFFLPEAGLISIQTCSLPLGAALHFYAATGQWASEEMILLKNVLELSSAATASMANDFLLSMAADAAARAPQDISRGDPRNLEDHAKMARDWYHVADMSASNIAGKA